MSAENIAKLLRDWAGDSARVTYPALREDLIKAAGWIDGLSTSNANLMKACETFFSVLRGGSSYVKDAYELHVSKAEYSKARDLYDEARRPASPGKGGGA